MVIKPGLTAEQLKTFDDDGVLCIEDFLSPKETRDLLDRSLQLLKDFDISTHPKTQFKTGENDHIGDEYFFNSSDKVGFFFDTDAFDDSGNLKYPKELAINKIGHGLHMNDDLFHQITFSEKIKGIGRLLGFIDPRVLQSMCIFKQPVSSSEQERDNAVPPHTDGTFLYTEPQSAIGFWFSLEDCTAENGCLSYSPGSHKMFPITNRFVKVNDGKDGCNFISVDNELNKESKSSEIPDYYKMVECKAGSLILIHNSVLHKSEKNRSPKSRFAYTFHVIDGRCKYDKLNWLQVPPGPSGGTQFTKLFEEI